MCAPKKDYNGIPRSIKLSHLMKQGGVACKERGIIPFYFAFSLPSVGKPTPPLATQVEEF